MQARLAPCIGSARAEELSAARSARGSLIQEHGMKVGVALKPGTPMEAVAPFVGLVDMVLVMRVQP